VQLFPGNTLDGGWVAAQGAHRLIQEAVLFFERLHPGRLFLIKLLLPAQGKIAAGREQGIER